LPEEDTPECLILLLRFQSEAAGPKPPPQAADHSRRGQIPRDRGSVFAHRPERGYIDPNKPYFVISRKTEKELTGYRQITVNVCFWFGIIAFLAAAFCFLEWFGLINVV